MRNKFLVSAAAVLLTALAPLRAMAGEIWLTMDQVRNYELKDPISSIVVGNPAIADVTVQSSEKILLYGKAPGLTNIFFFDKEGNRIENLNIRVQSPTGNMLVLHKGVDRSTFSCATQCELTAAVGDSEAAFGQATSQAAAKVGQAVNAAGNAAASLVP